jgi:hypothetical protein
MMLKKIRFKKKKKTNGCAGHLCYPQRKSQVFLPLRLAAFRGAVFPEASSWYTLDWSERMNWIMLQQMFRWEKYIN